MALYLRNIMYDDVSCHPIRITNVTNHGALLEMERKEHFYELVRGIVYPTVPHPYVMREVFWLVVCDIISRSILYA